MNVQKPNPNPNPEERVRNLKRNKDVGSWKFIIVIKDNILIKILLYVGIR
jgi:hypothetical protein